MGYITKPPPSDDEYIWERTDTSPGWTWGEHRQMEAMLDELDATDETVKQARKTLDEKLEKAGIVLDVLENKDRYCEFCWKPEFAKHDPECREADDPADYVNREAGGYKYLSDCMVELHVTSVPMTDEEALEYFGIVNQMFYGEGVCFIMRRPISGYEWSLMPYRYDVETNQFEELVQS